MHAYQDTATWYKPSYQPTISPKEREKIEWELDAFEFGNPQLLIQQEALSQILEDGNKIVAVFTLSPRPISSYRQPEIEMIEEEDALPEIKESYTRILKRPWDFLSSIPITRLWPNGYPFSRLRGKIPKNGIKKDTINLLRSS